MLYAALILLSLIWGGSFFFIKILLGDFGPWSIAFLRSCFGLLTVMVIVLVMRKPLGLRQIPWVPMLIGGMLNTAVPWALIGASEIKLTSSMASVLNATTPLWTMVIGLSFFGARSTRNQWMGMAIGFVGLVVLLDVNPESIISVDLYGFLGMVAATLCYGISAQMFKRYLKDINSYQMAFGTLIAGLIVSGIISFMFEPITWTALTSWHNLATLVGLGVFGSGVAYILYSYLIVQGSPEFASTVTYLVPVTAILWGYSLLGEELHWSLLTGLVLILSGVYFANRKPKQKVEETKVVTEESTTA